MAEIELIDFGDAMVETKQRDPYPPIYWDYTYGLGPWPESAE